MKFNVKLGVTFLILALCSCEGDFLEDHQVIDHQKTEFEAIEGIHFEIDDFQSKSNTTENLKIATFNTYGASKSKLQTLKSNLPSGVNVICFQEIVNVSDIMEVFSSGSSHRNEDSYSSFPYCSVVLNKSTKNRWPMSDKKGYSVIISKFPIIRQSFKLIQRDPHGDKWERIAQYVKLKVNTFTSIDLFNYHNTNRYAGVAPAEEGIRKFRIFINESLGLSPNSTADLNSQHNLFIAGDMNLNASGSQRTFIENTFGTSLSYAAYFVDYVISSEIYSNAGVVALPAVSDHDLLWASYSIPTNRSSAFSNTVRVYEHSRFRGRVATFETGQYPTIINNHPIQDDGSFWNDRVSSIRVGGRVQLYAFEHYNYNGRDYSLPNQSGYGSFLNDEFSSLKVFKR
jgi:hypothetical protein